jgi:DNA-damage-inducible protein J
MNDMVAKKDVVVTTIRIERETKEQADRVFRSLGLNFNSGVDLYLRKVVRDQAIPFDLSLKETEQQ